MAGCILNFCKVGYNKLCEQTDLYVHILFFYAVGTMWFCRYIAFCMHIIIKCVSVPLTTSICVKDSFKRL